MADPYTLSLVTRAGFFLTGLLTIIGVIYYVKAIKKLHKMRGKFEHSIGHLLHCYCINFVFTLAVTIVSFKRALLFEDMKVYNSVFKCFLSLAPIILFYFVTIMSSAMVTTTRLWISLRVIQRKSIPNGLKIFNFVFIISKWSISIAMSIILYFSMRPVAEVKVSGKLLSSYPIRTTVAAISNAMQEKTRLAFLCVPEHGKTHSPLSPFPSYSLGCLA